MTFSVTSIYCTHILASQVHRSLYPAHYTIIKSVMISLNRQSEVMDEISVGILWSDREEEEVSSMSHLISSSCYLLVCPWSERGTRVQCSCCAHFLVFLLKPQARAGGSRERTGLSTLVKNSGSLSPS